MSRFILYILMILAMIAWGETWISAKVLSNYLSSQELIFWRFIFTSIGLIPILIFYKISIKISIYNLSIIIISALLLTLYNSAFFLGTKYGLASFGGVLVTTLNPIVTFILIAILSGKNFKILESFGLIVGITGVLVMLEIWKFNSNIILSKGNIYYLLASFLWPILTIVSSKQKDINSIVYSFYLFLFTSIITLIYLNFTISNILEFNSTFWLNIILISIIGTTFATTIYFFCVVKLGSKISSSFFFLVPTSAIAFAIIFLKESITLPLITGGVLTIFAVYIINLAKYQGVED